MLTVLLQTVRRVSEVTDLREEHLTLLDDQITLIFDHCKGNQVMIDTLDKALLTYLRQFYGA